MSDSRRSERGEKNFYINDLPYDERRRLCSILDMNDYWKELGGKYLKLNRPELDMIGKAVLRKQSPTDELLSRMESYHCRVVTLFTYLYHMKHFQAMDIIKSFVDSKHHHLIPENPGLEPETFSRRRSESTKSTLVDRYNKENIKDNAVLMNAHIKPGSERTTERKLSVGLDSSIPFIPFEELERATNFWHPTKKLGRGGFGVVHRGYWRETDIAIKRLEPPKKNDAESNVPGIQMQQFLKELKHLNISRHDNILPLYGYSIHEDKYVLVYQFMPHGSLDDRLHRSVEYLPWNIRHKIAQGTARGLQFLHSMNPALIHGDIKSANILLGPHFDPKIGDFGLAREGPKAQYTHVNVSRVYGTRPYLPFEFLRSKRFSKKVDVYSFGVVLFEVATGKKPYDETRSKNKFLRDYVCEYDDNLVYLMDPRGKHENHLYLNLYKLFIDVGKSCVESDPKKRPDMVDVFKMLEWHESVSPFHLTRRNSLIPPTCSTIPPTSISPLGSHDRRRSPSPTQLPPRNFTPSPVQTNQSPWNLPSNPPGNNQPPRISTPVLSPSPMQVVAEVSSCDKILPAGNGIARVDSHAVAEQNLALIPDIKLIPPNESRISVSHVRTNSGSSSVSTSESEPSTHCTNTGGSTASEVRPEENVIDKDSESQIPNLTIFHG